MTGYLRRFPAFEILTDADVALLERLLVVEDYRDGHVFVREGERATAVTASMFLVLDGRVDIVAEAPQGGFGVKRSMGPGGMFGLVAFVTDVKRTATVRAAGKVTTARLDRRTFDALYRSDAGVHARFQIVVARQLAHDLRDTRDLLARAIESGNLEPVAQRFAGRAPERR